MPKLERFVSRLGAAVVAGALLAPAAVYAQSGKIVCWKDKSGKVVGCGDKVPPEYQSSATKELDSHGVTRKQTESVDEANRRREKEQGVAKSKTEEDRKALDQRRQDIALMETYASEKEIDVKRDRDLQVLDLQIEQLQVAVKNTTQNYNDAKLRADTLAKNKKPMPPTLKEEFARATADKQRFEQSILNKNKEKEELRTRYAEYRKRFIELRSQQTAAKK